MLSAILICYLRIVFEVLQRVTEIPIGSHDQTNDARLTALTRWLTRLDVVNDARLEPASDDASFRRYFRLQDGDKSFIAMDAPPERENSRPFIKVAGYLEQMQLNAPRVVAADLKLGFLLLTDLGTEQYLDVLRATPQRADALYGDAIKALLAMQQRGERFVSELPPYDETLLRFELSLFRDWLCSTHLHLQFSRDDEFRWQALCDLLVANALQQPSVFVHRDYHSRNLMVAANDNPGILDFQDAVAGPLTYDLVSLLKDCYIRWPERQVREWALGFNSQLDREVLPDDEFLNCFELMGVQRHLKASGIFCRLCHRDGKTRYLDDVPQTLRYITEIASRHDELQFIAKLIDERVLPRWQTPQCAQ